MRNIILMIIFFLLAQNADAQDIRPILNVRVSCLLFPFTPLATLEIRTFGNLTLQGESNFKHTHGFNLKYYTRERMNGHYFFIGSAFVSNKLLRKDEKNTILPYVGYGYSYNFAKNWLWDTRLGIGPTINADKNAIYPIIKTGIGRKF
jgi:hypothetical protein